MAINLLNIKPNKVSRDLSGYITWIYGAPKTGKTTLATQMDGALLLAFERGYSALPGVFAQDVTSWAEMKQVMRELKKPEVKETFKAVIVDTINVAADMCKKYICNQNDIEELGDLGYGRGWTKFKDEFNDVFRGLAQLGYSVFFIGHDKETMLTDPATGTEKMVIRPSLSNSTREIIASMTDIYGYAHQKTAGEMSVLTLRSPDGSIECGCRFKYMPEEITMSYQNLVNAISDAIDKEAAETNGKFVTEEKQTIAEAKTYDYDALMAQFQEYAGMLMNKDAASYGPKVTHIVEKYLGKGKKISETNIAQAEIVNLIVEEIKEDLVSKMSK